MARLLLFGYVPLLALLAALLWGVEEPPLPSEGPPVPEPVRDLRVVRREALGEEARAAGEAVLRAFLPRWAAPECSTCVRGLVFREESPDERVFLLWVRGYPSLAEAWAGEVLSADFEDWEFEPRLPAWAVRALGLLTAGAYPGAEDVLLRLCEESPFRSGAIAALVESGAHVRHERFLRKLAAEGEWAALEALSYFEGELPSKAPDRLVARVRALRDGTWAGLARRAILEDSTLDPDDRLWALRIARARRPGWLEGTLRERLARARPVRGGIRLEDPGYLPSLLLLADIGGGLDPEERAYLRRRGYGGDPRARLAEILQGNGA